MQNYTDLITLCDNAIVMAETWEDVTKDGTQPLKEWVVEYTVVVNEETNQHLNIMQGEDLADVQRRLLLELRKNYAENERIDVTVQRMEEIKATSESVTFEGCFTP
jgi:hypothetical protein|tara:strand:+ start:312 stop:629 length:318 start_codon:yes stop_codon:yes gene_type:complete